MLMIVSLSLPLRRHSRCTDAPLEMFNYSCISLYNCICSYVRFSRCPPLIRHCWLRMNACGRYCYVVLLTGQNVFVNVLSLKVGSWVLNVDWDWDFEFTSLYVVQPVGRGRHCLLLESEWSDLMRGALVSTNRICHHKQSLMRCNKDGRRAKTTGQRGFSISSTWVCQTKRQSYLTEKVMKERTFHLLNHPKCTVSGKIIR